MEDKTRQQTCRKAAAVTKICGIGTVEAAEAAVSAGADIIGMIFAPSPRLIDMDRAKTVAQAVRAAGVRDTITTATSIPSLSVDLEERMDNVEYFTECASRVIARRRELGRPLLAGVFQNQDVAHIAAVARAVPLDLVQLHGTEAPETARLIPVPVIKVFHVDDSFSVEAAELRDSMLRRQCHSLILLDTKVAGTAQQGGRGVQFDWSIARRLADMGIPFLMAGGLTPDNVAQAVGVGRPWGVDVSSGIETNKTKDVAKIHAFVRNANS